MLKLKPSDVAVAVAIEGGLFTPVLKDAEMKSLSALSAEMKDLATRARDRKLSPPGIPGRHLRHLQPRDVRDREFRRRHQPAARRDPRRRRGRQKPVVGADGELTVATVMSVTLSVDHRVIDGALGAELLQQIVDNLENPMVMLA